MMSKKKSLLLLTVGAIFFCAAAVFAQTKIEVNFPGVTPAPSDPAQFISAFYKYALSIGGVLAFGAIVWGGIRYTFAAGNPSGQTEGKEWIKAALWGLVLLVSIFLLLNTINPELTKLVLPKLGNLPESSHGSGGSWDGLSDNAARAALSPGITVLNSLDGTQQSTIDEINKIKQLSGCPIQVNSTVTSVHDSGTCSHANGYKADIQRNDCLDAYIWDANKGFSFVQQTSRGPCYADKSSGNTSVMEAGSPGHWDMNSCGSSASCH